MGLSPTQVRVAANELARARCLRLRRTATSRTENSGRYAQGFFLPGPTEERGPGRSPRLRPVVLLIESNQAIADAMGRVLRELGALPLGVSDLHEARRVLEHLAFELVVVGEPGDAAGAADDGASDLGPAAWAARCGPVIARGGAVGAPDGAARAGGGWSLGLAGFRVAAAAALGVRPAAAAAVSRHAIVRDDEMLAPAFD
jgi:hypothetical protein